MAAGHDELERRRERARRHATLAAAIAATVVLTLLLLVAVVLMVLFGQEASAEDRSGAGPNAYPSGSGIPAVYWPIYVAAAERYEVSPYLLASIHKQETDFSADPSARSGENAWGAGGPMQFLASTWRGHADAFRPIAGRRPESYPLDRRTLPSCRGVPADAGCRYDDFDAIAAAAHKLSADGADTSLSSEGTHRAVCAYIGACSEVDACRKGSPNRYCEVLPRAREWEARASSGSATVTPGSRARLLPNGLAAAPEDAPESVKRMIAAANAISGRPYKQVHYPTHIDNPTYDCSSSTSHVLWAGGTFGVAPWCSAQFAHYGKPGPGTWVTVYSHGACGSPEGHVFIVIAGLRFDTSGNSDTGPNAGKGGPRWRTPRFDTGNFIARHPEGL